MSDAIWRRIRRYVEQGHETPKVDLKLTVDLSKRDGRAEFAKDVTAIANTPGGTGYLIIGVLDSAACPRDHSTPEDYVVGFTHPNADNFYIQMIEALNQFCKPVPDIEYHEVVHEPTRRNVGVVTIKHSNMQPHSFIRPGEGVQQHDVWIRRGTATFKATPEEIIKMATVGTSIPAVLINLSGHPLTEFQKTQLFDKYHVVVEELIEVPVHFDPTQELSPQIAKVIDDIDLAVEEWSERTIYVILPGLAPGAAAILAAIHGLKGGFPSILWIYQSSQVGSQSYEIAQIIDGQSIRDTWRQTRTQTSS
ncbi:CRISPR-associated protein Csx15 [Kyrpidia spormannii]|uniref:Transcriptional regulator n=1 Tax=Kyrpidia spormannii TaxID=2055160 RepID=A0ACA8Z6B9_9BACL|nr:CRISPR-associated protein Csx15 [Kyrpidia spormannii]CAB3389591.1 putative transcriptional regulator [Kyrpidia spormannii]